MKYKDLFIDFDDTLYNTYGNAVIALQETFEAFALGQYFDDPQTFYDAYWAANIDLWTRYSRGEITRDFLIVERFRRPLSVGNGIDITEEYCLKMSDKFLDFCASKSGVVEGAHELMDYLRQKGGRVFYNADNEHLCDMVAHRPGLCLCKYGVKYQNATVFPATAEQPFLKMELVYRGQPTTISTHLVGDYNADNVMAALGVGEYFDVPYAEAVKAIESYVPSNSRSQLLKTKHNPLIIDAYNANPSSMRAALDNFANTEFPAKILMLGDMLELGADSAAEHMAILKRALEVADKVYLVGGEFGSVAKRAVNAKDRVLSFPDIQALKEYMTEHPVEGATILIKGSNGNHMQDVVPAL